MNGEPSQENSKGSGDSSPASKAEHDQAQTQVMDRLTALARANALLQQEIRECKQAKEELHSLMDTLPDSIYFKDRRSRFIRANKALADWVGVGDPCRLLGKTDFDLFTEEHARQAYEDEQEIL